MSPIYYLLIVAVFIIVMFGFLKRPMYEVLFLAFILVTVVSGNIDKLPAYMWKTLGNNLLYAISAFIVFSVILNKTGVVEDLIEIIIALVGKLPGGAGYVSILASSAFASLSGSAPGNAASIGSITVKSMMKTGFSPELATAVNAHASALGPVIPPSGAILTVFGMLCALYPDVCTLSQFWVICWGMCIWLIVQRLVTLFIYVKKDNLQPIPEEDLPSLSEAMKKGWKSLLLPIIIIAPFIIDSNCAAFFTARLGEAGKKAFSGSLLSVVASLGIVYSILIAKDKSQFKGAKLFLMLQDAIKGIAPCGIMIFAGFAFGEVFNDVGIAEAIQELALSVNMSKTFFILVIPFIWTILGMFVEPLTLLVVVGQTVIALAASVGVNPVVMSVCALAAGHAMANTTPPVASTFYVSLGFSKADFVKSAKIVAVWCFAQYIVIVLMLYGILPIMGLGSAVI